MTDPDQMKNTERPLITVGITTYDRPAMLRDCVTSVLSQSYGNIEVIIGNDYVPVPVSFETLGIAPDPRVRIVNHERNIGAFENNHFLPVAASGEWFTWLADDDLMHPEFLETAWKVFSVADVVAVFSDYSDGVSPEGIFPRPVQCKAPRVFGGNDFFHDYTMRRFRTVGAYGVFNRRIFQAFRGIRRFGSGLPVYGDTFLPLFAAARGKVAFIDQPLVFLRTHPESRSVSSSRLIDYASAQRDFVAAFAEYCGSSCSPAQHQDYLANMVRWFASDSWTVVCRANSGVWRRLLEFSKHAVSGLLPVVRPSRRPALAAGMVRMAVIDSLRYMASNLLRKTREAARNQALRGN